tara:strand:+ start:516 stop:1295 length:780 start_codon:yes stop_codon:yes gene_type:complete
MGKAMMGTGESEGEGRALKAAEIAITNPLIDDYTLKGAKGLLVNITGGKDLKLFEVDEAVNKVRSEVDQDAELIIGAITDERLDGKMRVSIVATALDGQQPEAKSVINMVHRIQNRNTGYSEFPSTNNMSSFNFNENNLTSATDGANALKLDNEVVPDVLNKGENINDINKQYNEEILNNQNEDFNTIKDNEVVNESKSEESLNGLENFSLEEDKTPELFNSEENNSSNQEFTSFTSDQEKSEEEDDLEIPAFLRRQKN